MTTDTIYTAWTRLENGDTIVLWADERDGDQPAEDSLTKLARDRGADLVENEYGDLVAEPINED